MGLSVTLRYKAFILKGTKLLRLLSWRVTWWNWIFKKGLEASKANVKQTSSESIAAIQTRNHELLMGIGKKGVDSETQKR